jgi:ABC-type multidrug transport system fused ATPase/permease subunit
MENGKIVGTGTHKQLLKSTPLYKELAATQLLD